MRYHKPILTPAEANILQRIRAADADVRAAEAAKEAAEEKLADWVLTELRSGRTLDELIQQYATDSAGIDLAAIVDRRLGLSR